MCEKSQPSGGGGPAGSPPYARMTSSFLPLMQLLSSDDIDLNRLQPLYDLHVPIRCCEPVTVCKGHLGVFVSHVLKSYCISPDNYSRHSMYVGLIIVFLCLMF